MTLHKQGEKNCIGNLPLIKLFQTSFCLGTLFVVIVEESDSCHYKNESREAEKAFSQNNYDKNFWQPGLCA